MLRRSLPFVMIGLFALLLAACAPQLTHDQAIERSQQMVPNPPWPEGDQAGMGNTQGQGTWMRCAPHLTDARAQAYELGHERSQTMPQSPFAAPLEHEFNPPAGIPFTRHGFHTEVTTGNIGGQGTQFDALGHFAYLPEMWDGEGDFPAEDLRYYGGYTHDEVQPGSQGPLQRLGMEHVPPIVTSAVLLDAREYIGGGEPLDDGEIVTPEDIEGMLEAQGLGERGLLPGDVLYIYTGWERHRDDTDEAGVYYTMGPGLGYESVEYLEEHAVALVALDNPFTDPAPENKLTGQAELTEGMPPDLPFGIHHYNLTQSGVYQIQNARLAEMANDGVWTSCTMVLPSNVRGAAQAPVRPVSIGAPDQATRR